MSDAEYLARFRAARTPEALAGLLRGVTAEHARALARHLGEARFYRLRELAAQIEPTRGPADRRSNVVVLAGSMWTELSVTEFGSEPALLWVHRRRIAAMGANQPGRSALIRAAYPASICRPARGPPLAKSSENPFVTLARRTVHSLISNRGDGD